LADSTGFAAKEELASIAQGYRGRNDGAKSPEQKPSIRFSTTKTSMLLSEPLRSNLIGTTRMWLLVQAEAWKRSSAGSTIGRTKQPCGGTRLGRALVD